MVNLPQESDNRFVKGLSEGIQVLANYKLNQMHQNELQKDIQEVYGLSPVEARLLSKAPEEVRQKYLLPFAEGRHALENQPKEGAQNQMQKQGEQSPEQMYSPENLQQALQYLQSPEAQQELAPEEIQQATQKAQELLQNPQLVQQKAQQMQAQPQQAPQPERTSFVQGLGAGQATNTADKVAIQRERLEQKKVQDTNKLEKPYNDRLEKQAETSREVSDVLDRMERNLNSGKVQEGLKGRFGLKQAQSTETQEFVKDGNTLVRLLTEGQSGVPTGFRIKFNAEQKPNIELKKETNERLLRSIREENNFIKNRINTKDEIIKENNGNLPANFPGVLRERLEQADQAPEVPAGTPEGDGLLHNGKWWVNKGGKAVPYEG